MKFEEALAAMREGSVLRIDDCDYCYSKRVRPIGVYSRRVGAKDSDGRIANWTPATLSGELIARNDWQIVEGR